MSDMYLGSQAPLYQNVRIIKRSKNGKILEERFAKNRITRLMLYGIAKFLLGHYNSSSPDKIYEVIPRYIALGTNTPPADGNNEGVTTISSINDSRLLNEIKYTATISGEQKINRIQIVERNMCKINTKFTDPYIKISIKTYISEDMYDGKSIGEAGLFSKEKDNNCLARVCFNPIVKNPGEILEIQWDITLLSYGETKYPSSISLNNGSNIVIPLYYLGKKFVEIKTGFHTDWSNLYHDDVNDNSTFSKNKSNEVTIHLNEEFKEQYIPNVKTTLKYYNDILNKVSDEDLTYIAKLLLSRLDGSHFIPNTNDLYIKDDDENKIYLPYYFNSLINNNVHDNYIKMFLMFDEKEVNENVGEPIANMSLIQENSFDYYIYTVKGINTDDINSDFDRDWLEDEFDYRIYDNRIYKNINTKMDRLENPSWSPTDYFLSNGFIININGEKLKIVEITNDDKITYEIFDKNNNTHLELDSYNVTYNGEYIYLSKLKIELSYSYQFLSKDNSNNDDLKNYLRLYKENNLGLITPTEYLLDYNNNNTFKEQITSEGVSTINDTMYHLDKDNHWVMSNYEKLVYTILPTDSTDKSVLWSIQNKDIAKINQDGVVTSWNIGETIAIGKTANDISTRCNISVVKESTFIETESITLNPDEATFYTNDINTEYIIEAIVKPIYATSTNVTWKLDSGINNCVDIINLGNNRIKLILNDTGNIGSGYLIATDQSGKSASCLINIIIGNKTGDDCENDYHKYQEA